MSWLGIILTGLVLAYLATSVLVVLGVWLNNLWATSTSEADGRVFLKPRSPAVARGQRFTVEVGARLTTVPLNPEAGRADIVLALDCSSSMHGESVMEAARGARQFVRHCRFGPDGARVGVVVFNDQGRVLSELTSNPFVLFAKLRKLPEPAGGTSIHEGMRAALMLIEEAPPRKGDDASKAIILLTVGSDGDPRLVDFAESLGQRDINLYCLGVEGADRGLLNRMAAANSRDEESIKAHHASRAGDIAHIFEQIKHVMVEPVGKNGEITVPFNCRDLVFHPSANDGGPLDVDPLRWQVPWMHKEGETVRFQASAEDCMGIYPLTTEPNRLEVDSVDMSRSNPRIKIENQRKARVIVTPFAPASLWLLLANPIVWGLLARWMCPTRAEVVRRDVTMPEPPPTEIPVTPLTDVKPSVVQSWHPTLCIGLGSAGIAVAARLKSFMADASDGHLPENVLRTLCFDTDFRSGGFGAFGVGGIGEAELFLFGSDTWEEHQKLVDKPELRPWYDAEMTMMVDRDVFDTRTGTKRLRGLGRLSLHRFMEQHPDDIEQRISEAVDWLDQCMAEANRTPVIVLTCCPGGGTGGAVYHDILHLLLRALSERKMDEQIVFTVLPDAPPSDPTEAELRARTYRANRVALALEMERVRMSLRVPLDTADYPGVRPIQGRRTADVEIWVRSGGGDFGGTLDAAASLASAFASASGSFTEKFYTDVLTLPDDRRRAAIVNASVNVNTRPQALFDTYLTSQVTLKLLMRTLGIESIGGRFELVDDDALNEEAGALVLGMFGRDMPDDLDALKTPQPAAFPYVRGLAEASPEKLPGLAVGTLEICSENDPMFVSANSERARVHLTEWVLCILTAPRRHRLALAVRSLGKVDILLREAQRKFREVRLDDISVNELPLFSVERVQRLDDLLVEYLQATRTLATALQSWAFALTEGFPWRWSLSPPADRDFVGLCRHLQRRLELIGERLLDYGIDELPARKRWLGETVAAVFAAEDDDDCLYAIEQRLQWRLPPDVLMNRGRGDSRDLRNPFTLTVIVSGDEQVSARSPAECRGNIEDSLTGLVESERPWRDRVRVEALQPPTLTSRPGDLPITVDDSEDERTFPNSAIAFVASVERASILRETRMFDGWRNQREVARAERNHVLTADRRAASLQAILTQVGGDNAPFDPVAANMLHDLHRLQRFICLAASGRVEQVPLPGTTDLAWSTEATGESPETKGTHVFLTVPETGKTMLDAAANFVLRRRCLVSGSEIPVNPHWRPDADEVGAITQVLDRGNLEDWEPLLPIVRVMHEVGGYFDPTVAVRRPRGPT